MSVEMSLVAIVTALVVTLQQWCDLCDKAKAAAAEEALSSPSSPTVHALADHVNNVDQASAPPTPRVVADQANNIESTPAASVRGG